MQLRPVVAAAILDHPTSPTRLLVARRARPEKLRGLWELPGGKIEDGESPEEALVREIREELGTCLTLGPHLPGPADGWWPVNEGRPMSVHLATLAPGAPAPTLGEAHLELRWADLDDLDSLDWIPEDLPVAHACREAASRAK